MLALHLQPEVHVLSKTLGPTNTFVYPLMLRPNHIHLSHPGFGGNVSQGFFEELGNMMLH